MRNYELGIRKPLKRELSQRDNIINKENNRRLYKDEAGSDYC